MNKHKKTRDKSVGFCSVFLFGESGKINPLEFKEVNEVFFVALLFIVN